MRPAVEVAGARVFHGDCREVLKTLPDNSVDSVVTDPPYELGFMGKKWDSSGIAYDLDVWRECLRVLKPGGHILAFGGSRTWHRLAVAVEDAGFELRDSIAWLYGSGFPKSLDVSKAIDKGQGVNRDRQLQFTAWMRSSGLNQKDCAKLIRQFAKNDETATAMAQHYYSDKQQPAIATAEIFDAMRVGLPPVPEEIERLVAERTGIEWTAYKQREVIGQKMSGIADKNEKGRHTIGASKAVEVDITAPSTPEAKHWEGWGTALKPAFEPVVVGRKPLVGTVAENVLEWGVGGLNIDGSRIATDESWQGRKLDGKPLTGYEGGDGLNAQTSSSHAQGRWPANVILDEVTAGLLDEQSGERPTGSIKPYTSVTTPGYGGKWSHFRDVNHSASTGGASRFFYVAKASKRDRNEGLEELEAKRHADRVVDDGPGGENPRNRTNTAKQNFHPTVKPTQLMRYLIKLVTPPGGTVLDPFTGSGSTGKAALLDGYQFVGAELTEEYLPIIEGRLRWASEQVEETDDTLF